MRFGQALFLAGLCGSIASAAEAAERHRLSLPGGRLGDAVAALGRQARVSIAIADPSLARRTVPPVGGFLTIDEALRRLLRGHDARLIAIDAASYRIVRTAAAPSPRRPPPPPARSAVARQPPPAPAPPQRTAETSVAEIVVTAARGAEPLSSYPGSTMVIDGGDPGFAHTLIGSDAIAARLPAVSSTHLGPGRNKLFIRGISDSSFQGPTQATVGQYLGETRLNYNAPDPDLRLFDLERVEVLAGPQGTTHGAGSLGGIIRLVPSAPKVDQVESEAWLALSATQHGAPGAEAAGMINGPLADGRVGLRVSAHVLREGGYIDDLRRDLEDVNRVQIAGGRFALRVMPSDTWVIDVAATGQRIDGRDAQYAEGPERLSRRSNLRQNFRNDYLLGNAVAVREWGDSRLVLSSGLARQNMRERFDATRAGNPPAAYDLITDVSLISSEARLSRRGNDETGWLLGAALIANRSEQTRAVESVTCKCVRDQVRNSVKEVALFGDYAFRIAPRLVGTFGGRINYASLSSSGFAAIPGGPFPAEPTRITRSETRFLPAAAVAFRATPDLFLFGRYQQGFRPGGAAIAGLQVNRFQSDKVAAIEVGGRFGVPGIDAFDAAAAVSYTRWTDIQADTLDLNAEPTTVNIGDGRIFTLDLSLGWRPVRGLSVEAAAVLNDSALTNSGTASTAEGELPNVARLNGRLAAHYAFNGFGSRPFRASAAARYAGKSRLGVGEILGKEQGEWLDVSLSLAMEAGSHGFTLSLTNLFDTAGNRFALGSPFTLDQQDHRTPLRPRTLRLGWKASF